VFAESTDPLADPIGFFAAQHGEYDWTREELILDDRYRRRQLPLLENRSEPPWSPDSVQPGEFWPPVRSVVLPIDAVAVGTDPAIGQFVADLRDGPAAGLVWWEGLARRAERLHATVCGAIDSEANPPDIAGETMLAVVRGPWIGRVNTGRIYLPVEIPDAADRRRLVSVRDHYDVPHRPLLAGYLQLTDDLYGAAFVALRQLILEFQEAANIPLAVTALTVLETMDDLALRSRVVGTIAIG
jgi:hypothetical protein